MILGNQRLETIPLSEKLKGIERRIQQETNSGVNIFFNEAIYDIFQVLNKRL